MINQGTVLEIGCGPGCCSIWRSPLGVALSQSKHALSCAEVWAGAACRLLFLLAAPDPVWAGQKKLRQSSLRACNACCKSSYFIHIGPEETRTLRRIPKKSCSRRPGPKGYKLLGSDEQGHCPMLVNDRCSIYEDRPQTCRTYDCRIFTATGIHVEDEPKNLITRQIRRWKFRYPTPGDLRLQNAVQAAAGFLQGHAASFPAGAAPANSIRLAVLALKVYEVFLKNNDTPGRNGCGLSEMEVIQAIMKANEKFGKEK